MNVKTRPLGQPGADGSGFVGAIVVHDEMDIQRCRDTLIDGVEELAKLGAAMPPMTLTDHYARLHVQGGNQRRRPVTLVIVTSALRLARAHGQQRLRPVQGLNLGLLVNTQNQRPVRGIQVKPYDIPYLVNEQRVFREFEGLATVRL